LLKKICRKIFGLLKQKLEIYLFQFKKMTARPLFLIASLCIASMSTVWAGIFLPLMVQLPPLSAGESTPERNYEEVAQMLKQDKSHRYRVQDLSAGNPFIQADAARSFQIIGGYSAAKLRRYEDLIQYHISNGNPAVYDMLNTRYLLEQGADGKLRPSLNNGAAGNVWLIKSIRWVNSAEEELGALYQFNPREEAIVHREFSGNLQGLRPSGQGQIALSAYSSVDLNYKASTTREELAVFPEIWYGPDLGWEAYINGRRVEPIRVNYALRGLRIPAGYSEIRFLFRPKSVYLGRQISFIFSLLSVVALGVILFTGIRKSLQPSPAPAKK